MYKIEQKMINTAIQYRHVLFFAAVTFLSVWLRMSGRGFVSDDMIDFLLPWYDSFQSKGGWRALSEQIGDYNLAYQTFMAAVSQIPWNPIYMIKGLSLIFDYALAMLLAVQICKIKQEKIFSVTGNLLYAAVLFLPTVVFNSAFWGQCDSIYTFFLFASWFAFYHEKYRRAFILFGLAAAFKLQALFFLPLIFMLYFYKKNFSLLNLGWSLLTFWGSGIIAYINGRDLLAPFTIYMNQADTYHAMQLNMPSFWLVVSNAYETLHQFGILLALILLGTAFYLVLCGRVSLKGFEFSSLMFCWVFWTLLLFLPAMHERYSYPLDLMLVVLLFFTKRYWFHAASCLLISVMTYSMYLFNDGVIEPWYGIAWFLLWAYFTVLFFKQVSVRGREI